MKAGYTVESIISKGDMLIQVSNFHKENEIINISLYSYTSYLKLRDKNTVGFWKIKK